MTIEYISNGINGATGTYLTPPLTAQQLSQIARGTTLSEGHRADIEQKLQKSKQLSDKGIIRGKDPKKLEEAGWGVIFATQYANEDATGLTAAAIRDALAPLLKRRKAQATAKKNNYYREFFGTKKPDRGFESGYTKRSFLLRNNVANGIGVADPDNLPYYLLIVGDPATIPFSFQYELDVEYAVGRICFDTLDEYRHYAETVVAAEQGQLPNTKRATFFSVRNPDDDATFFSDEKLVPALIDHAKGLSKPDWTIETYTKDRAYKCHLQTLLGGADTPDFLFTASHGLAFPPNFPQHPKHQGALLCRDWPGKNTWGERALEPELYFSADDVAPDAQLDGLVAFHFACYGAGTPVTTSFPKQLEDRASIPLAEQELIAPLPKRLLGHEAGGALAVISHIDLLWTRSFQSEEELPRLGVFQSALSSILDGDPIGLAMEFFNQRYGVCATELHQLKDASNSSEEDLASSWLDTNDARNYIILGDPAVKIGPRSAPDDGEPVPTIASDTAHSPADHIAILEQRIRELEQENESLRAKLKANDSKVGD